MQEPTRRLTKGHERMIGGVASGFAEYLDVDPTLVRVGLVLAGLFHPPAAILAYIAFIVIMPAPGDGPAGSAPLGGQQGSVAAVGVVLLVIGGLMLFGSMWSGMWLWGMPQMWGFSGWFWPVRLVWPVLIVLAGVFLLTRRRAG